MIDRWMRQIWNSPWTQIPLALYFGWYSPPNYHGWVAWLSLCVSISCWLRFLDMGRKRWGQNSGACEVCGKPVQFNNGKVTGARLTRKGVPPRFACKDHVQSLADKIPV